MANKKAPAYLLHKPSGQARVRIHGKDHYLGAYGTAESRHRYEHLATAWLREAEFSRVLLTVDDLVLLYLDFASGGEKEEIRGRPRLHSRPRRIQPA